MPVGSGSTNVSWKLSALHHDAPDAVRLMVSSSPLFTYIAGTDTFCHPIGRLPLAVVPVPANLACWLSLPDDAVSFMGTFELPRSIAEREYCPAGKPVIVCVIDEV